jgi:uncharacterized membrane-anchored protein
MDNPISDKVIASTGAATALAGAVCLVAVWVLRSVYQVDVPVEVREALVVIVGMILTGAATLAAGWVKKEKNPSASAVRTVHRQDAAREREKRERGT